MNDLYYLVQQAKQKSLSNFELLKMVKEKANLLLYPELIKYNNIDKALGKFGALILLYETSKNYGHWVGVFKRDKNTIEHFDSYGLFPDDELKFIPEYFRDTNNERLPHLTALLYKSGYNIEYNDHKLQQKMKDVNTCGRWVGMRLLLRNLHIDEFIKIFINNKCLNPDDIVTLMSFLV